MHHLDITSDDPVVIGLAGTHGAGKQSFSDFFATRGFRHFSAREDVLKPELKKRERELQGRSTLGVIANSLRKQYGPQYVAYALYERAREHRGDAVIESIYNPREVETIKMVAGRAPFVLVWIDADIESRYERIREMRKGETDMISFDQFVREQEREMRSEDPDGHQLLACRELADVRLTNDGSPEDFHAQIMADPVLARILASRPLMLSN